MASYIQQLIRWMPLILFILLLMVDRENNLHVIGYIILLLSYTGILVLRVLYAKEEWHNEFNKDMDEHGKPIEKMSDYKDQFNLKNETDTES